MDDQNKNLIVATALSFLVILVWFVLFPPTEPEVPFDASVPAASTTDTGDAAVPVAPIAGEAAPAAQTATDADATSDAPRVNIDTARITGSISLAGGRLDDLAPIASGSVGAAELQPPTSFSGRP